jgi:hypothetical protein
MNPSFKIGMIATYSPDMDMFSRLAGSIERSSTQYIENSKSTLYNLRKGLLFTCGVAIITFSLFLGGCARKVNSTSVSVPEGAKSCPSSSTVLKPVEGMGLMDLCRRAGWADTDTRKCQPNVFDLVTGEYPYNTIQQMVDLEHDYCVPIGSP